MANPNMRRQYSIGICFFGIIPISILAARVATTGWTFAELQRKNFTTYYVNQSLTDESKGICFTPDEYTADVNNDEYFDFNHDLQYAVIAFCALSMLMYVHFVRTRLMSVATIIAAFNNCANPEEHIFQGNNAQVAVADGNEQLLIEDSSKFLSDFVENFQPISFLGQGGFGVVFECRSKVDQCKYAIKRIRLSNKPGSKEKAGREVQALKLLNKHKNIVEFINSWTETPPQGWQEKTDKIIMQNITNCSDPTSSSDDEINDRDTFLYIQMELCQKESLKTWLENNRSRDFVKYLGIFHQVLSAVEYLHANNLIHRDLKPSNIMFSLHGDIKLGDFGLVTETDNEMIADISTNSKTNKGRHTKGVGTKSYMAPEQMSGGNYGKEVDIFALGLILFELLSPFFTFSEKVYEMGKARELKFGKDFQSCRNEVDVAKQMISFEPSLRPSAQEVKRSISRLRDNVISTRKMIRISDKYIESEMKLAMEFEIFLEKLSQNPDITLF